jgi:hypothetical protein
VLTPEQVRKIQASIVECNRFIAKEYGRAADLRPASVAFLLHRYKVHRLELTAMLEQQTLNPVVDATRKVEVCNGK